MSGGSNRKRPSYLSCWPLRLVRWELLFTLALFARHSLVVSSYIATDGSWSGQTAVFKWITHPSNGVKTRFQQFERHQSCVLLQTIKFTLPFGVLAVETWNCSVWGISWCGGITWPWRSSLSFWSFTTFVFVFDVFDQFLWLCFCLVSEILPCRV